MLPWRECFRQNKTNYIRKYMKKRLAQILVRLARRLDPQLEYLLQDQYEPRQLGIGYHITKKDVKQFREDNPQYTSHRKGLEALIEETKKEIGTNIFAGIYKNDLIVYEVKKSFWTADVTGRLNVYVSKEKDTDTTEAEG